MNTLSLNILTIGFIGLLVAVVLYNVLFLPLTKPISKVENQGCAVGLLTIVAFPMFLILALTVVSVLVMFLGAL